MKNNGLWLILISNNMNRKTNIFAVCQGWVWIYCKSNTIWTFWQNGWLFISLYLEKCTDQERRYMGYPFPHFCLLEFGEDNVFTREGIKMVSWITILISALPKHSKWHNLLCNNTQQHVSKMQPKSWYIILLIRYLMTTHIGFLPKWKMQISLHHDLVTKKNHKTSHNCH